MNKLSKMFPNKTAPNKTMVNHLIRKFHEAGSVMNQKCNHTHTVLSDDTLEDMRLSFLHSPSKSPRKTVTIDCIIRQCT
jgi:hypothetical protein